MRRVRALLRHTVPKGQVERFLQGTVPHEIEFRNHQSVYDHLQFSVEAVQKLVITRTAHLYGPLEGKPKVVNPLSVALNGVSERLVVNGRYINSFMKKIPFKYERLWDILVFLKKGGFVSSWDLKSGYYHVVLHPKYTTYLGIKLGDAYLHFNAVCFGWMEACFIFTTVMQEIFLEVRARAIPISSYVDDGLTTDQSRERCLWAVVLIIRLLTCLGAFFGLSKCHFEPSQEGAWLRFEVVTTTETFRVSDKKLDKVKAALRQLLEANVISPR